MILSGRGRYSKYLRPISVLFDILVISLLYRYFFKDLGVNNLHFTAYQVACWSIISYFSGFYEVYRYSTAIQIFTKLVRQGILFLLVVIAFFPFQKATIFSGQKIAEYMITAFSLIGIFKFLLFYYLKRYRITTGSNYRNVIIVGFTQEAINLKELFDKRADYGYRFFGYFSDTKKNAQIVGGLDEIKDFATLNNIDDIYCSINELDNAMLKDLVEYAELNNKTIKFIPDTKEIFSKNLRVDYYEVFPVLSLRKTPLHDPVASLIKRIFDIIFSLLVVTLLLSWLIPLMAILIKLESKGPVFFKQSRAGVNGEHFSCYKFRSMQVNNNTERITVKGDPRITRIGKFIRKTSIDEMPQFLNVLLGDMSVVGPRPHIGSINTMYTGRIKKYFFRHSVKPGITGLAQVRGARGEINADEDMINRIKYDVFYIENWSLLLDLKIIIQTVSNMITGDEKAY
ncbi:undecaprenyl-phosphate glucose phosphotransferase [Flavobacterium sp. D11R37]|uniref:undecaprenyl-phosphate glucose phosphotransferase n=1 Tax=Flavobacterium coralii TaxID=2838017 RepID=UPI001CA7213A|nr:undecaprenyl-phosphate glucose phosphotransferase [Flavobacterium coralii]MBY8963320.1 undecaprenyl-phosphate glucose phosphotransferase [Flavobacterium coralii]